MTWFANPLELEAEDDVQSPEESNFEKWRKFLWEGLWFMQFSEGLDRRLGTYFEGL